jgi:hypothetical protein
MTDQEIRHEFTKKALDIESHFMDSHVPPPIRELYFLVELIRLRNLESYFQHFGWEPIDPELAREGKITMRWGQDLSAFELDCIRLLNAEIERREHERKQPALALPASSVRAIG